jgi:molybdopterin-containing oxidoreductase family membrane subunit
VILEPGHTFSTVTEKISAIVLTRGTPRGWFAAMAVASFLVVVLLISLVYLFGTGVGIWGVHNSVGWGFAIVNMVWWIGIGHAGTLISAILLLLKQKWRTSINRFAEAMTLFAVACAVIYPLAHIGRPWVAHWFFPVPSPMGTWPNFRSPLIWDVFAISTYGLVSLLFWFVGLIPDLATLRDRAHSRFGRIVFGLLAMGWRGSGRHWHRYEAAYVVLAGLATPLVVSVHSVVGLDFAASVNPGWHATFVPPYFVAGAIFSGFAMVMTLAIPLRALYGLEDFITARHLANMSKIILATGLIVSYAYLMEIFFGWYSGNEYEIALIHQRFSGQYAPLYWSLILCNVIAPQFLWIERVRMSVPALFALSLVVNVGMWLERFVIIPGSLAQGFLPSKWVIYWPTFWDWATFVGTLGLFFFLMLLFIRFLPVINIFEMRGLLHEEQEHAEKEAAEKGEHP